MPDRCTECGNDCHEEWYGMVAGLGAPYIMCAKCYKKRDGNWGTSTYGGGTGKGLEKPMPDKCYECKHHGRIKVWNQLLNPGYCNAVPRDTITGDVFTCKEIREHRRPKCEMWEAISTSSSPRKWWHRFKP